MIATVQPTDGRTMIPTSHFPARLIFFDCDSTLTSIEGIDELARLKGQFDHIAELTRRAMDGEIKLEEVFATRLDLLRPTRADLRHIAQAYRETIVPDAKETIAALRFTGCQVYIVSGGLLPAVQEFARSIGLRNPYVDALSAIQVELLGRLRDPDLPEADASALRAVIGATINGIAAGLRNSG